MSYMRLYNTHIRENGKKRNLFDKVNEIKEKIKVIVPEIDEDKWLTIIHHVRQGKRNQRENKGASARN